MQYYAYSKLSNMCQMLNLIFEKYVVILWMNKNVSLKYWYCHKENAYIVLENNRDKFFSILTFYLKCDNKFFSILIFYFKCDN